MRNLSDGAMLRRLKESQRRWSTGYQDRLVRACIDELRRREKERGPNRKLFLSLPMDWRRAILKDQAEKEHRKVAKR